jgi:hypothetical protein
MMQRLSVVGGSDGFVDDDHVNDVVEIPLLLQGWQMTALETAAHKRGQTAGAMVRDLLRDFLARLPEPAGERTARRF